LLSNGQITARIEDMSRGQGERLMPLLEELLAENNITWANLDGIGVGTGPGNFTGIRISVSAARGLALGLGVPAVGVSNFEAVTHGVPYAVACIPAPRAQAYVQNFVAHGDRDPVIVDLADATSLPNIPGKADPRFCGPAAEDIAALYYGGTPSAWEIAHADCPPIEAIARIAAGRLHSETARPAPMYVKPPDAAPAREGPPVILP
jgi:tRNA threonylcarbamoyl adenosine modification protein YeaZ